MKGKKIESVLWCWAGIGYTRMYGGFCVGRGTNFCRILQRASLLKLTSEVVVMVVKSGQI